MNLRFRIPKHDHIPVVPLYSHYLSILQFTLATLTLGLIAATLSHIHDSRGIPGFVLFVSPATMIVLMYRNPALFRFAAMYNHVAVRSLECLLVMWWLAVFAALATWSAGHPWVGGTMCGIDANGKRYCVFKRCDGKGAGPRCLARRSGGFGIERDTEIVWLLHRRVHLRSKSFTFSRHHAGQ